MVSSKGWRWVFWLCPVILFCYVCPKTVYIRYCNYSRVIWSAEWFVNILVGLWQDLLRLWNVCSSPFPLPNKCFFSSGTVQYSTAVSVCLFQELCNTPLLLVCASFRNCAILHCCLCVPLSGTVQYSTAVSVCLFQELCNTPLLLVCASFRNCAILHCC